MQFTPEALQELKPFIEEIVAQRTKELSQKLEVFQADNNAFRKLLHQGEDE